MSIIIRLQNLPITAKSADIRNFFGGLRIPDGGVHILGGENGDAFIGFNSDEDARLAMRKDGGKIYDSRIKLFLSSRMEMQYEVEKLTKCGIENSSSHKSYSQERTLADEDSRYISSERMIYSQSPFRFGEQSVDRCINLVQHDQASQSPVGFASRPRSRSPRKRSRSSRKSQSLSPESKNRSQKSFKASRRMPNYVNLRQIDLKQDKLDSPDQKNYNNNPENNSSTSEIQAELERRINEAIEKNSEMMARGSIVYQGSNIPGLAGENMHINNFPGYPYLGQNFPCGTVPNNFPPFPPPPPPLFDNVQPFHAPEFQHSHVINMGQQHVLPPPIPHPNVLIASGEVGRQRSTNGFYVTISGLDPLWNFKEIQMMLKGIYAPENNIRWEIDDTGFKTGTAFVKLMNSDDFGNVLRRMTFFFNGHRITVSECPDFLSHSYFSSVSEYENEYMQQNCDFCYKLKGLPFTCTYEDIINFFQGFVVADVLIMYGKDNKATGTGFVSFSNRRDFEGAFQLNGNKILHRYIEMMPSSERELMKVKKIHPSAQTFTSYSQILAQRNLPPSRRPLCAVISGLPFHTSKKKLNIFFSDSGLKPDVFHITLNKKKVCDGRTFVEFTNFRDFDVALKLHGSSFKENIVCIKQILYDEMIKILDTVKAKHYFETPVPASASDIPEKVPYLWEPPDAYDEQEKLNFSSSRLKNQYLYSSNNTIKEEFNPIMGPNTANKTAMSDRFRNKRMPIGTNFDPHFKHQIVLKREVERVPPYMTENSSFNIKAKDFASDLREPIKFSVNKPSTISTKINETFDSTKNVEKKSKLSKLSPEKEDSKISLKTKDVDFKKKSPERKEVEFKKKSPERKDCNSERRNVNERRDSERRNVNERRDLDSERRYSDSQRGFKERDFDSQRGFNERDFDSQRGFKERDFDSQRGFKERDFDSQRGFKERGDSDSERNVKERDSRIDKHKSESKNTFSRNRYERESKRSYEIKIVSHRRSISPVNSSFSERKSKECVVHLSNVSTSVGTPDLLEFLREFVYYKDTISRRYTDEGEPTGDVRVTFYNKSEAELAIRTLNGRHLKGVRIIMFLP